jgi:protein O-mannosyl-transferase
MARKTGKRASKVSEATEAAPRRTPFEWFWTPLSLFGCALVTALIVFGPALHGAWVFDDAHLPFADPHAGEMTAKFWLSGVRPTLMATYWANYLLSGTDTLSYHVVNVMLHAATAVLVFFIFERMFSIAGFVRNPRVYALAGAALFLFHPLQTESVDYIAGRSELMSGFFFCGAWLIYLRTFESETRIVTSIEILVLAGAAVLAKENAICLPAVLFATDVFWAKRPFISQMRRRVKLYVPFIIGGASGAIWILRSLTAETSAGFSSGNSPARYALTECRVILTYVRLFFVPVGQNGDWQMPFFYSLADGGAWLYVLGLLALVAGIFRISSRLRLVAFGLLIFLLMLAPTSSVVPIRDALAERRMYMPITGLILASIAASVAIAERFELKAGRMRTLGTVAVLVAAALTWHRSAVWSGPVALWGDSVAKNPSNPRAHLGLGDAFMASNNCQPAVREFTLARSEDPSNEQAVWNLAEALQCAGQFDRAEPLLQSFANSKPSANTWNQVAFTEAHLGRTDAVFAAIDKALSLDPNNATSYAYRGLAKIAVNNAEGARADVARALDLDPHNPAALAVERSLSGRQGR